MYINSKKEIKKVFKKNDATPQLNYKNNYFVLFLIVNCKVFVAFFNLKNNVFNNLNKNCTF